MFFFKNQNEEFFLIVVNNQFKEKNKFFHGRPFCFEKNCGKINHPILTIKMILKRNKKNIYKPYLTLVIH